MRRTLIVGGGVAGMAAAIAAAEKGDSVTVLERGSKILKKLGVTGNGRGNLLNSGAPQYFGDAVFAEAVLKQVPYQKLAAFWGGLGVPLREEGEGRVYPAALQASVAVDALRLRAAQLGVQVAILTQARHIGISQDGGFVVEAVESVLSAGGKGKKPVETNLIPRKFYADRVIVTVGGAAAPAHGTDGTAYGLLTDFGHALAPARPALCALMTEKKPLRGLFGLRVRAALRLCDRDGRLLRESAGEALFAEDGVSGIAAMQLARFVLKGCVLHMDLRPALNMAGVEKKELLLYFRGLAEKRRELPIRELCTGLMAPQLSRALLLAAGITAWEPATASLKPEQMEALVDAVMDFTLDVEDVRGFDSAQVTAGGIPPREFDWATMESRLQKGLYAAGEVLDVDGDCGGFNLMLAVASGLLAGRG